MTQPPPHAAVVTGDVLLKNRPEDTAFKQQRITAWQPVMSPRCAISSLGVAAVVFLVIGIVIIVTSDATQVLEQQYDQEQSCDYTDRLIPDPGTASSAFLNSSMGSQYWACPGITIRFTVTKTLKAPVYLYYKIENMNQNHRSYAKSQSVLQLAGENVAAGDAGDCSPLLRANERKSLSGSSMIQVNGNMVDASQAIYNPCGLIPWSLFNDSVVLEKEDALTGNVTLVCETSNYQASGAKMLPRGSCTGSGIAWSTDPGVRFMSPALVPGTVLTSTGWSVASADNTPTATSYSDSWGYYAARGWYTGEAGHRLPSADDEDLMVWMRLALMADFRKLFRIIDVDLEPGSYRFTIFQRYDVRSFGGKKSLVLTTSNWIGGQNYWLGGLYIGVGAVCAVLSLAFLVKYLTTPQLLSF